MVAGNIGFAASIDHDGATTLVPEGPTARRRPFEIPHDLDDPSIVKADGLVELPLRLQWSGGPRLYDLRDRRSRAYVYEQVLREGTADDIRHYVRLEELVSLWGELFLPEPMRHAWAEELRNRVGVDPSC